MRSLEEIVRSETMDAEYYRERAALCHRLATTSEAARPLFERLGLLAKSYEFKAIVIEFGHDQPAYGAAAPKGRLTENKLTSSALWRANDSNNASR